MLLPLKPSMDVCLNAYLPRLFSMWFRFGLQFSNHFASSLGAFSELSISIARNQISYFQMFTDALRGKIILEITQKNAVQNENLNQMLMLSFSFH